MSHLLSCTNRHYRAPARHSSRTTPAHRSVMNRKHVGAIAALVIAVLAVGFFAFRGCGDDAKPAASKQTRTGKIELPKPQAKQDDAPAPQGMAPRWSLDVDPEGPLRLEGQVVDEDGHGVA